MSQNKYINEKLMNEYLDTLYDKVLPRAGLTPLERREVEIKKIAEKMEKKKRYDRIRIRKIRRMKKK